MNHKRSEIEAYIDWVEAQLVEVDLLDKGDDMLFLCRAYNSNRYLGSIARDAAFMMMFDFICKVMRAYYKRPLRFYTEREEWYTPHVRKGNTKPKAMAEFQRVLTHVTKLRELIERYDGKPGSQYRTVNWCFKAYQWRFGAAETILNASEHGVSLVDDGGDFIAALTSKRVLRYMTFEKTYRKLVEDGSNGCYNDILTKLHQDGIRFPEGELREFYSIIGYTRPVELVATA